MRGSLEIRRSNKLVRAHSICLLKSSRFSEVQRRGFLIEKSKPISFLIESELPTKKIIITFISVYFLFRTTTSADTMWVTNMMITRETLRTDKNQW